MYYDFYVTDEEYAKAKEKNISYDLVNTRIRSLGWSKEKAINTPVKKYSKKRNKYGEWANIAIDNNIPYSTFAARVRDGMDVERAATRPLRCKRAWAQEMRERRMKKIELRTVSN